jgi:predicted dehydrogenase
MKISIDRRDFIKTGMAAGMAAALGPKILSAAPEKEKKIRIGIIGIGLRGTGHLDGLLQRGDVTVPAVCDIDTERFQIAQDLIAKAGDKKAEVYQGSETAYKKLLARGDLDAVLIATPWLWHFPMALDAMKAGIPVATEVAGAASVQECWDLVEAHETTGTPFMFLENVCYRRDVMAVLNMIRQNLFGELIHCRCGYQHDLREVKFQPGVEFGEKGVHEARWRTEQSVKRNGDLDPTHGAGPVAMYLNVNRGNRFVSLTSTATQSRGLHNYIVEHGGENHPNAKIPFALGDVVTTVIRCANGESVLVTHDTNLPRPYSLGFYVHGTKGIWNHDGDRIYFENRSPEAHVWEKDEAYLKQYDHPLWKRYENRAEGAGHGGMDFFVLNAFVECLKRKEPFPIDVYDAAAWQCITPLSEQSIAEGGEPQEFPDFTRGAWIRRRPVFAVKEEY